MGRKHKAAGALVRLRPPSGVDLDGPIIARFTERFRTLRRQTFRNLVGASAELGQILEEARPFLKRNYQRWLRERLNIDPATARNYVSLARLSADQPELVARLHGLGPSKLYRVARLDADGRLLVLRSPDVETMTDHQFAALTAPHVVRKRPVTPRMRANGLREKLRGWTREMRGERVPRVDDPELREALREEMAALLKAVRALAAQIDGDARR